MLTCAFDLVCYYLGYMEGKERHKFLWHLIWFATTWVIWKERNDINFRGTQSSLAQLSENVKLMLRFFIIFFITGAKTFSYVRVLANFATCY